MMTGTGDDFGTPEKPDNSRRPVRYRNWGFLAVFLALFFAGMGYGLGRANLWFLYLIGLSVFVLVLGIVSFYYAYRKRKTL